MVPALIETIQEAGLLLVADATDSSGRDSMKTEQTETDTVMPDGVNGLMKGTGVLTFIESTEV